MIGEASQQSSFNHHHLLPNHLDWPRDSGKHMLIAGVVLMNANVSQITIMMRNSDECMMYVAEAG